MVCLFFSLLSCFCQFLSFVLAVFAFLLVEIYVPVSKKKKCVLFVLVETKWAT